MVIRIIIGVLVFGGGLAVGKWWAGDGRPARAQAPAHGIDPLATSGTQLPRPSISQRAAVAASAVPSSLEAIAAEASTLRRRVLARRYFDAMPAEDFPNLLTRVTATDDPDILLPFFLSWTAKEPAAALDAADPLTSSYRGAVIAQCIAAWARRDHAAAAKWAERLTGREKRGIEVMLERMAQGPAKESPAPVRSPSEQFWSHVSLSANGVGFSDKPGKVLPALRDWVRSNPAEASQAVLRNAMLRKDEEMLRAIYEEWKVKDPAGADQFLSGLPPESADVLVLALALEASEKDVAVARLLAERLPTATQRSKVLAKVGARLVAADPSLAPGWIQTIQQVNPDTIPMSIFAEWFKADPAAAARALTEHPIYQKARAESPDQKIVSNSLDFRGWVEKDPAAAGSFLANLPKSDRASSLFKLGENWVDKDAHGAIQWARSLPNAAAQDEALRQFTYSWAKSNALGVTRHLDSLPAGSGKSAAIEGFAFATFDVDPDAVLHWTRAIPDEQQRLDVLSRAWSSWREKNNRAADDWVKNIAELQPAERKAIGARGGF